MTYYYIALQSRAHAFLLERRLAGEGIPCELTYLPREITSDLCNLGVKFDEAYSRRVMDVMYRSGLPGYRIYRESMEPWQSNYYETR